MEDKKLRFEIEKKLGSGAYGTVYKCFDCKLKKQVALKKLKMSTIENHGIPGIILREISVLMALDHPNIVKLIDVLFLKDILLIFEFHHQTLYSFLKSIPLEITLSKQKTKVI